MNIEDSDWNKSESVSAEEIQTRVVAGKTFENEIKNSKNALIEYTVAEGCIIKD